MPAVASGVSKAKQGVVVQGSSVKNRGSRFLIAVLCAIEAFKKAGWEATAANFELERETALIKLKKSSSFRVIEMFRRPSWLEADGDFVLQAGKDALLVSMDNKNEGADKKNLRNFAISLAP